MQQFPLSLDVVIPCYNASHTLERAVQSVLLQTPYYHRIILVDDASQDQTWHVMQQLKQQYPEHIQCFKMPSNAGVAAARNWGAMQSRADLIAFLDADDAYQANALLPVIAAFHFLPFLSLVRLKLTPVDLATRYAQHPDLAKAWDILQMTVGGNMIFRRNLFLASGGFPQDDLFRTLGGEDVSLGIAFAETTAVGTLFAEHDAGVLHYCRDGMHAERLLDAYLFQQHDPRITPEAQQYAAQTTQRIKQNLQTLMPILQHGKAGRTPLTMQFE